MFPPLYHAHHNLSKEDLQFWLALAHQSPGPILELGCGTGRVLRPLLQAGYPVFGLDIDFEMLAFLRANLPARYLPKARIFQADFSNFSLSARFGLVIMPCNTYSSLAPEIRQATLERVQRHRLPEGRFVVSLPNPQMLRELPANSEPEVEELISHPVDKTPVQVSSAWKRTAKQITFFWHYDHMLPDGNIQRVTAQIQHSLTSPQEYMGEMKASGFEEIMCYGDFDRSPYSTDSLYLILDAS